MDDIPKGEFVCDYAGHLLTSQGANEEGTQFGDEYLAELDHIESVERKYGYESDVDIDIDDVSDASRASNSSKNFIKWFFSSNVFDFNDFFIEFKSMYLILMIFSLNLS